METFMSDVIETLATLTDRYQTTVPEPVRRALKLGKRDKIRFSITGDGEVVLSRASDADPVLEQFLHFLERDMAQNPARLHMLTTDLRDRIDALIGKTHVDLDAPLSADDE
jgi:antitoxin PrlF